MGIWIRSQNKIALVNAKEIRTWQVGGSFNIYVSSNGIGNEELLMGIYGTKERALEVLDQIQQKLIEGHRSDVIVGATRVYKESVFEMPEE